MHRPAQWFSIAFIALYTYLSQPFHTLNYIWFLLAMLLFVVGWAFQFRLAVLAAIVVILGYGGYHLYLVHFANASLQFGWNELIWLLVFPYASLMGGIGKTIRGSPQQEVRQISLYQLLRPDQTSDEEMIQLDERLGFLDGVAFVYKLEEEVILSLREKKEFTLLIAAIDKFAEYKTAFGIDSAQLLLHQLAERVVELEEEGLIRVKGHLGEGLFAFILPVSSEPVNSDIETEAKLNEFFMEILMNRPRRESRVKIRLVYGSALCPADGIEARSLMDKAQSEIEGNVSQH